MANIYRKVIILDTLAGLKVAAVGDVKGIWCTE